MEIMSKQSSSKIMMTKYSLSLKMVFYVSLISPISKESIKRTSIETPSTWSYAKSQIVSSSVSKTK